MFCEKSPCFCSLQLPATELFVNFHRKRCWNVVSVCIFNNYFFEVWYLLDSNFVLYNCFCKSVRYLPKTDLDFHLNSDTLSNLTFSRFSNEESFQTFAVVPWLIRLCDNWFDHLFYFELRSRASTHIFGRWFEDVVFYFKIILQVLLYFPQGNE